MEFESTDGKQPPPSHVCVVYDPRDGRIVHGHEFVGDGGGLFGPDGREERERDTLEGARRNHGDVSRFRVLHVQPGFRFAPNVAYRVDTRSGRLIESSKWPSRDHGSEDRMARKDEALIEVAARTVDSGATRVMVGTSTIVI